MNKISNIAQFLALLQEAEVSEKKCVFGNSCLIEQQSQDSNYLGSLGGEASCHSQHRE